MGIIADRLDSMVVRAAAPGGSLSAELRGRSAVFIRFEPGTFQHYDERLLERHLAAVARQLWAGRTRAYYAAVNEATVLPINGELPPNTQRDVEYDDLRSRLVAEGCSADGTVSLSVRGMREWDVRVSPGATRQFSEREFAERVRAAAEELINDQYSKILELKQQIYADIY